MRIRDSLDTQGRYADKITAIALVAGCNDLFADLT